ncbi:hypothetical protein [Clostridium sp.]|uniref:hypothetical protein n=1 Tax=Clostridium sp. TaxID=1506 RepID=UPI0039952868
MKLINEIILIICPTTLDKYVKLVPTLELREYVKSRVEVAERSGGESFVKGVMG